MLDEEIVFRLYGGNSKLLLGDAENKFNFKKFIASSTTIEIVKVYDPVVRYNLVKNKI